MSTNFVLTLDTTAPAGVVALLAGGVAATATPDVNLHTTTTDPDTTGYQMKVWGDVAGAATEGAAVWVGYALDKAITLTGGDGLKTVNVRLRDDVGNESAVASDTITLDVTAPTINITIDPSRTKISKVNGFNVSTFSFASDQALQVWSVRVVPNDVATHTEGTEIATANGSASTSGAGLAAVTNQQVTITGADLELASGGDGPKVIKVFGEDVNGNWSA